ncbi:MAG: alpha/beta hydrolase [Acidimicrobiales bacterium]
MTRTRQVVGTAMVIGMLLASCSDDAEPSTAPDEGSAPTTETTATCPERVDQVDVSYVDQGAALQQLDLYQPPDAGCAPVPVVVWVHGGGWRIGDKGASIDAKVRLWNAAGWAVASVNYRLTDAALPASDRVVAPAHNEDAATALGWLVDHAEELGINPGRLALLGHSAGAGVVAALATDPTYLGDVGLEPTDLGCVAPLDTEAFDIGAAAGTGPQLAQVYEDAFGTDPSRWAELSPITHVGEAALPEMFLVTRGTAQRRQVVSTFAAAAEAADGAVTVVDLPGFSHEDVNKEIGAADDTVLTPALQDFLAVCLAG